MPSLTVTCQATAANCSPASRVTGSPPPDTVDGHPGGEQPELRGQRPPPVDGSGSGVLLAQSDAARPVEEQLKVRAGRHTTSASGRAARMPSDTAAAISRVFPNRLSYTTAMRMRPNLLVEGLPLPVVVGQRRWSPG